MTCRFPRLLHGGQDQQDKARSPGGGAEGGVQGGRGDRYRGQLARGEVHHRHPEGVQVAADEQVPASPQLGRESGPPRLHHDNRVHTWLICVHLALPSSRCLGVPNRRYAPNTRIRARWVFTLSDGRWGRPRQHPGLPPAHPGRLPHAGKTVTIQLGDTTLRIIDQHGELISTVPRVSYGEISRFKAYGTRSRG
jgi:hypothetical protein